MKLSVKLMTIVFASSIAHAETPNPHQILLDNTIRFLTEHGATPLVTKDVTLCQGQQVNQDKTLLKNNASWNFPVYAFSIPGGRLAVYKLVNAYADETLKGFPVDADISMVNSSRSNKVKWDSRAGMLKVGNAPMPFDYDDADFMFRFSSKSTGLSSNINPLYLSLSIWNSVEDEETLTHICLRTRQIGLH